jgi:hypothetical protein
MSKFVKVKTELRDLAMVKRAMDDLAISHKENVLYTHIYSGTREDVPLVGTLNGVSFALRPAEGGVYEIVGDDMQLARIKQPLGQLQQRYAYHKVLAEVESAGFALVEESVAKDKSIRLTVRRWSDE